VQKRDAGPHDELGAREVHGEVAEVFDAEGRRELAVVEGEPDFFPGLAAGDLVCDAMFVRELRCGGEEKGEGVCTGCFVEGVGFASWEGGVAWSGVVSARS
jgi:hypothetical protein